MQEQYSALTGERIRRIDHPTGLTILVNEKPSYNKAYAVYATKFGSVNNVFVRDGRRRTLPDGIAHFLEHKLFENEEGDAFLRFGPVGGNANAFTDFDMTAYLFSCTEHFDKNLEILLDFVQRPYFTEKSVAKEQGIIGQEIRMYDDDPGWRVTFNLLAALYRNHPVRIDIAGTCETIAGITPELLYETYEAFYSPRNMVLCVCGHVTAEEVLEIADRVLKPRANPEVERVFPAEPDAAAAPRAEQRLSVARPLFALGYKNPNVNLSGREAALYENTMEILAEIIVGKGTALYHELYEKGLINASFGSGYQGSESYGYLLFEGESDEPDAVADAIRARIAALRESGVSDEEFERCRRAVYGRLMGAGNSPERIANNMAVCHFRGIDYFTLFTSISDITPADVTRALGELTPERAALSVILPERK